MFTFAVAGDINEKTPTAEDDGNNATASITAIRRPTDAKQCSRAPSRLVSVPYELKKVSVPELGLNRERFSDFATLQKECY